MSIRATDCFRSCERGKSGAVSEENSGDARLQNVHSALEPTTTPFKARARCFGGLIRVLTPTPWQMPFGGVVPVVTREGTGWSESVITAKQRWVQWLRPLTLQVMESESRIALCS
jgi:hypothetical protein